MPYGSAKDKRDISKVALFIAGLLLLFGTIPVLGFGVGTPIFAGFNLGTVIGLVVLYVTYLIHKNQI